tara:strand:- start:698 stop:928 length:231 start_codon:yes stop_codon:yes gene_type:complete
MFLRLQLIIFNLTSAILLIFFLCLGSQNREQRHKVNLLINETVSLPIGFLIGTSFTIGLLSGGITSMLSVKDQPDK